MASPQCRPEVAQLVAEHHQAAYRYAYRLTGSVQDAEDLTQDTFLAVHRKIEQLRNVGNPRAWLFAVLRNRFLKDRQRQRPVLASHLPFDLELVYKPLSKDEKEIDRDRLQEAMSRLPEDSRLILLMFYFEECSYREIAEQLDIPIGTVMSRLARAKNYLRSMLFASEQTLRKQPVRIAGK